MEDRRVQRTRKLLQGALIDLIKERGYDNVTIQDITDRANVGRTTFYLHYQSKEDLLLDHHAAMSSHFSVGIISREALMGDVPLPEMIEFLKLMAENRRMYHTIRAAKEADLLMRGVRDQIVANLENSLNTVFPDIKPNLPMDILVEYIIGAQLSLMNWWMGTRNDYEPEQIALMLHRLQRAAICDAYSIE
jgi:AcrR family transcriptional regulator